MFFDFDDVSRETRAVIGMTIGTLVPIIILALLMLFGVVRATTQAERMEKEIKIEVLRNKLLEEKAKTKLLRNKIKENKEQNNDSKRIN